MLVNEDNGEALWPGEATEARAALASEVMVEGSDDPDVGGTDGRERLAELEAQIETASLAKGLALLEIRETRLYRLAGYTSFEAYVRERWSISKGYAHRLCRAASDMLSAEVPTGTTRPLTEGRVRHLRNSHARRELSRQRRAAQEQERGERDAVGGSYEGEGWKLYEADVVATPSLVESSSVDLVLTDLPYNAGALLLAEALGQVAAEVLCPSGVLLCMCGHATAPAIGTILAQTLDYRWMLAYLTPGASSLSWATPLNPQWKPVLFCTNGPWNGSPVADVVKSDRPPNKAAHKWEQALSGIAKLIENFSRPGDLVLDCFAGSSTTGVAAVSMGRRYVGIDNDPLSIDTSCERLKAIKSPNTVEEDEPTIQSGAGARCVAEPTSPTGQMLSCE